ncbi:hypothetical protein NVP1155O_23 [Vibrio phage 1.155.O._10N.222.55.B3]|nr:hypothetical protein NVP1155O_23 [Vibrio phage 1.155.O._10N.222.55.B3]
MAEVTISDLRNLTVGGSSLLFAADGDDETFNISLNTILEYVRGELGILDTGSVEMYMGEVIPDTHTELDGKSFDPLVFPKMGALFPNGILPDTRGMTLKHAPDGRSVLSFEAGAIKGHAHTASTVVQSRDLGSSSTDGAGNHSHDIPRGESYPSGSYFAVGASGLETARTNGAGEHTHTFNLGSHDHLASTTVNASGGSKNLIDNIAVKFIIKKA